MTSHVVYVVATRVGLSHGRPTAWFRTPEAASVYIGRAYYQAFLDNGRYPEYEIFEVTSGE